MNVYEHNDPDSLIPRSHPWIDGESDPTHRYYDFRTSPELIRSSLEDMQEWSTYPATETFYRLLEWLNGPESVFESNDCAFILVRVQGETNNPGPGTDTPHAVSIRG